MMDNMNSTDKRIAELEARLEAASHRKARSHRFNVFNVAAIMLAATSLSVWLTSFMLAKYRTGGTDDDGARVAAFNVDVVPATDNPEMVFDLTDTAEAQTYSYNFTLRNKSETAVRYTASLEFKDPNVAAMISSIQYKVGETVVDPAAKLADIAPNGADVVVTVVFTVNASTADAAAVDYLSDAFLALTEPMSGWTGTVDAQPFTITVNATQID